MASNVYFGMSPMWVSTVILAVTYVVIMSEKINRAIIALIGASVMIVIGVFSQEEAIKGIDWNIVRGARDGDKSRSVDRGLAAAETVARRHDDRDARLRAGAAAASLSPTPYTRSP